MEWSGVDGRLIFSSPHLDTVGISTSGRLSSSYALRQLGLLLWIVVEQLMSRQAASFPLLVTVWFVTDKLDY